MHRKTKHLFTGYVTHIAYSQNDSHLAILTKSFTEPSELSILSVDVASFCLTNNMY